jgi:hypothetical protein
MDAFMTEAKRTGLPVARKRDEANWWLLYIERRFDLSSYGVRLCGVAVFAMVRAVAHVVKLLH